MYLRFVMPFTIVAATASMSHDRLPDETPVHSADFRPFTPVLGRICTTWRTSAPEIER
jgi:hypothetical protein